MAPRLHLERMMHRQSIAVPGDSAVSYALLKMIPDGAPAEPLPLTLSLCIDISGSMYWADGAGKPRLDRVREAASAAVARLRPTDRLAVTAFAHGAQLVLPATVIGDRTAVDETLRKIDSFDVNQSGTAMDEGIRCALEAVTSASEDGRLRHVVVLTDGETSGEGVCRELAEKAREAKVRFSIMGVGTEWNSFLIKDLARIADGRWHYIDADQSEDTMRVFLDEFGRIADSAFANVTVTFRPVKDVKIRRFRQVSPEIKEIPLSAIDDRTAVAIVGTLQRSQPAKYVIDMGLPRRPDGKYVVAQVEVSYDDAQGAVATAGPIALEMTYTSAGHGYVNAEVARHIDEVQIFEMNSNLQKAISNEDTAEIRRLAENISRKATVLGPRSARKTMLAEQVLSELDGQGKVTRKTMLAIDDSARTADEAAPKP